MTYNPNVKPSLGFIQASAVTAATVDSVSFDIDNEMGTTESGGKTDLKASSIIIMTFSRDNDGSTSRSTAYVSDQSITDYRFYGRIPSEFTNYFQSSEFSFAYSNNIEPKSHGAFGAGSIEFNTYSHAKIWRLSS